MQYNPEHRASHDQTLTDLMNLRSLLSRNWCFDHMSRAGNYCLLGGIHKIAGWDWAVDADTDSYKGMSVLLFSRRAHNMINACLRSGCVETNLWKMMRRPTWKRYLLLKMFATKARILATWNDDQGHRKVLNLLDTAIDQRIAKIRARSKVRVAA